VSRITPTRQSLLSCHTVSVNLENFIDILSTEFAVLLADTLSVIAKPPPFSAVATAVEDAALAKSAMTDYTTATVMKRGPNKLLLITVTAILPTLGNSVFKPKEHTRKALSRVSAYFCEGC